MNACEKCGWIHASDVVTVAGGRFDSPVVRTYIAADAGTPPRLTRAEAEADWCDWRVTQNHRRHDAETSPPTARAPIAITSDAEPPAPFPAAEMETLARAKAWRDFLADVLCSLTVWQLDATLHAACADVFDWLRQCRDELDALIPATAQRGES